MSLKMIKEAQAIAKLGNKIEAARKIKEALGIDSFASLIETFDSQPSEVTPANYQEWLNTLLDMAQEKGLNPDRKQDFNRLAFDILDNDSLVDLLGGDREKTKANIIGALWQSYKVSKAHSAVQDHVGTINKAREEEEMDSSQLCGAENEESGFAQTFNAAKGIEDEQKASPILKGAIGGGKNNPYPAGSLRHQLWADMHSEENEEDDLDSAIDGEFDSTDDDQPEDDISARIDRLEDELDDLKAEVQGGDADDVEGDSDLDDTDSEFDDAESDLDSELDSDEDLDDVDSRGGEHIDMSDQPDDEVDLPRRPVGGSLKTEEEEVAFDDEEAVKSFFRQAITSPKELLSQAIKDVEGEGSKAWMGMETPKNPHPKKSDAHRAWAKGFKKAAQTALGLDPKPVLRSTSKKRK